MADEYTPTTGQVRNAFGAHLGDCNRVTRDALGEFDRWLAARDAEKWDEGAADGEWNFEHEAMIERGIRGRIENPYKINKEEKR